MPSQDDFTHTPSIGDSTVVTEDATAECELATDASSPAAEPPVASASVGPDNTGEAGSPAVATHAPPDESSTPSQAGAASPPDDAGNLPVVWTARLPASPSPGSQSGPGALKADAALPTDVAAGVEPGGADWASLTPSAGDQTGAPAQAQATALKIPAKGNIKYVIEDKDDEAGAIAAETLRQLLAAHRKPRVRAMLSKLDVPEDLPLAVYPPRVLTQAFLALPDVTRESENVVTLEVREKRTRLCVTREGVTIWFDLDIDANVPPGEAVAFQLRHSVLALFSNLSENPLAFYYDAARQTLSIFSSKQETQRGRGEYQSLFQLHAPPVTPPRIPDDRIAAAPSKDTDAKALYQALKTMTALAPRSIKAHASDQLGIRGTDSFGFCGPIAWLEKLKSNPGLELMFKRQHVSHLRRGLARTGRTWIKDLGDMLVFGDGVAHVAIPGPAEKPDQSLKSFEAPGTTSARILTLRLLWHADILKLIADDDAIVRVEFWPRNLLFLGFSTTGEKARALSEDLVASDTRMERNGDDHAEGFMGPLQPIVIEVEAAEFLRAVKVVTGDWVTLEVALNPDGKPWFLRILNERDESDYTGLVSRRRGN